MFRPDILCTTDLSDAANVGIREGVKLAADLGGTATVLFVVDMGPVVQMASNLLSETQQNELLAQATRDARGQLEALCEREVHGDVKPTPVVVQAAQVAEAICEYAKQHKSHTIVTATHGRGGLAHMLLGSVAERVVRTAGCPVLVVRRPD